MSVDIKPFGEVLKDMSSGNSKIPKSRYLETGAIPVVDQGREHIAGYTDNPNDAFGRMNGPVIVFGDHTRCWKYIDHPFAMGADGVKVLAVTKGHDPKYIFYALRNLKLKNAGYDRHFKYLKRSVIPVVKSLTEQKRIAAILDKADGIRRKRQQALRLADDFLRSVFLDMFGDPVNNPKGWCQKELGSVVRVQGGFAFKSSDYSESGVRLVKISNVHSENIIWNDVDFLPLDYVEKYSDFSLDAGDVVIALTRPIIKSLDTVKIATVGQGDSPSLLNQRVARFVFSEDAEIEKPYLLEFCKTQFFKNAVQRFCSESLQPNMSTKQLAGIAVCVPSRSLQKKFSEIVVTVESVKRRISNQSIESENLFASLQQRAFRGEL